MPFGLPLNDDSPGQLDPAAMSLAEDLGTDTGDIEAVTDIATNAVAADNSWLSYSCWLDLYEEDHIAMTIPLAGKVTTDQGGGQDAIGSVDDLSSNTDPATPTVQSDIDNIIQRVSGPDFRIVLNGEAVRIQYPIAPPCLIQFAGQEVVQTRRHITTTPAQNYGGYMVEYLAWNIEYVVAGAPTNMPVPANITDYTDGRDEG